jgi:hypothetical protein
MSFPTESPISLPQQAAQCNGGYHQCSHDQQNAISLDYETDYPCLVGERVFSSAKHQREEIKVQMMKVVL